MLSAIQRNVLCVDQDSNNYMLNKSRYYSQSEFRLRLKNKAKKYKAKEIALLKLTSLDIFDARLLNSVLFWSLSVAFHTWSIKRIPNTSVTLSAIAVKCILRG